MPTKTPKTSTRKASSPGSKVAEAAQDVIVADAPEETDPAAEESSESAPQLRIKVLVDRVADSAGGNKKDVRKIVEATLTQLGQALNSGEMLNLPELGRIRVARKQGSGPGAMMTLKMRRGPSGGKKAAAAEDTLAVPEEQV